MWQMVRDLGFDGGRVLEPGCGSGTFLGMAPEDLDVDAVGVELDPISAGIAAQLNQNATIRAESFAVSRFPVSSFDLTIGNVPFGEVKLHDPRFNQGQRHSLHNHFLIKSLHHTRPGGLVAVITSRWTLDAQSPTARREMNTLGELVGAVRLPSTAHVRAAGTEAVTDILIFRRRDPQAEIPNVDPDWIYSHELLGPDMQGQRLNGHFQTRPEMVLGSLGARVGMHGVMNLVVDGKKDADDIAVQLRGQLDTVVSLAKQNGLTMLAPSEETLAARAVAIAPAETHLVDGHITAQPDGTFTIVTDGQHTALKVPKSAAAELQALLQIRDQVKAVVQREAASIDDDSDLDQLRAGLRSTWEKYVDKYGPINRFTQTSRVDAEGEEVIRRRKPAAVAKLQLDPFGAWVTSVEVYDEDRNVAAPAGILTSRQVLPRERVRSAETPTDALAVCLDEKGRVDLDYIAQLLGADELDPIIEQLEGQIYEVPRVDVEAEGHWITAAEFLSGNVRQKLADAQEAREATPGRWDSQIAALTNVIPDDIGIEDIKANLGAVWIPDVDVEVWARDLLESPKMVVSNIMHTDWKVTGAKSSVLTTSRFGTERAPAGTILKALLEQRPVLVYDVVEGDDGRERRVINPVETEAAKEKAQELQDNFEDWLWRDPDRAHRLLTDYNRRFNCLVARDYSRESEHMTFPGLVPTFTPRSHQRAAVARMIAEGSVGLFHEVGAGKTAEMVIGATELRRLGLIRKPMVVVPNHMLEQFTSEWIQLYPTAMILSAATDDISLNGDARRRFVAKAASNDWDAVIMTRDAFGKIGMSITAQEDYISAEVASIRAALEQAKGSPSAHEPTVKKLETMVATKEEQLKKRVDVERDPGITFEALGVDYLLVDELHEYKNLWTPSSIPGAGISQGSIRATDLHMKTVYLRDTYGGRVMTGATATPIANSVAEMFVMQRYLAPELLRDVGIETFDQWAATFGSIVTGFEMNATGTKYQVRSRFAQFNNVPELVTMFNQYGDIKTSKELDLPKPLVAPRSDGQRLPEALLVPRSPEMIDFQAEMDDRVDLIMSGGIDPAEDNMLAIVNDGRLAALDLRLVGHESSETTKVDVAAAKLAEVYHRFKDQVYVDTATGEPHPRPGGLQIVFCDLATPKSGHGTEQGVWDAYNGLREALISMDVPRDKVRFIHEARNNEEKARLFKACREGEVAVLIGSTSKMGTGTNIQHRVVHLLHMDAPWRPADVVQREGRAVRQGNQNAEVMLTQMLTEKSFDTFSWQTLERKAGFIAQVMTNKVTARQIEDIGGSEEMSFAQFKALSSGDPLMMEELEAQEDLTKLQRLHRGYLRNRSQLEAIIRSERSVLGIQAEIRDQQLAAKRTRETTGDKFSFYFLRRTYTSRTEALDAVQEFLLGPATTASWQYSLPMGHSTYRPITLGSVGGHTLMLETTDDTIRFFLEDAPAAGATLTKVGLRNQPLGGLVTRLENLPSQIPTIITSLEAKRDDLVRRVEQARQDLALPFKHADALKAAEDRYAAVTAQIREQVQQQALPRDQATEEPDVVEAFKQAAAPDPDDPAAVRAWAELRALAHEAERSQAEDDHLSAPAYTSPSHGGIEL